jgi:hypothetical protein
LVWTSPSTLFVAKTATAAEGNWAGFWGTGTVMQPGLDQNAGGLADGDRHRAADPAGVASTRLILDPAPHL